MAQRRTASSSGSKDRYQIRARRLRSKIRETGCDALLITNPNDVRYLTEFSGEDSYALVSTRRVHVISDFRFQEELESIKQRATIVIRTEPINPAAATLIKDLGLKRVAIQAEHVSIATRRRLAKVVGGKVLCDTTGLLDGLRVIKDDAEVRTIRKAVRIQEAALEATLEQIGPGWSEREIAALLEYEMSTGGADDTSFDSIVAAGANGSRPHYTPAGSKTAKGKPLLIDWGAKVDGYCSDMTRTFCFGSCPRKVREIYEIVLEAHNLAVEAVRPGLACRDLDAVARSFIARSGYAEQFGHGLGHGIGLDIHEAPRLSKESDTFLEVGMVVTIEPGIYLPGIGGVRIEDDILVTNRGGKSLCSLPIDLHWATL